MYYVRSNNKLWSELSRLAVCRGVDSMESTQIEKTFSFLYKKELLVLKSFVLGATCNKNWVEAFCGEISLAGSW